MHKLLPAKRTIALLLNPTNPLAKSVAAAVQAGASSLGLQVQVVQAHSDEDIDAMFASLPGLGLAVS